MSPSIRIPLPALASAAVALSAWVSASAQDPATTVSGASDSTASVGAAAGADPYLPAPFRPEEHATTWANPPFSREVLPPAAPDLVPDTPFVWDGWQIAAVDQFDGVYTVGLISKKNEFFSFTVGQAHEETGVRVTKVESSGVISDTVIHLTDGKRTGKLTFESGRLARPAGGKTAAKTAAATKQAPTKTQRRPVVIRR